MITEQDLREAIAECQGVREPNANTCIKLAAYYTILEHMTSTQGHAPAELPMYSYSPMSADTIDYTGESDFAKKINGMNCYDVLNVVDELMDTIAVLNPGLYNGVMRKLSNI